MSNVNKLEQEIASLIFNPHAVSQAEVESKRCEQLLKRRSTTSANRPYRENSAKIARQNAVSAIQHATRVEENARQIIDSLMGREAKQTTQEKVE